MVARKAWRAVVPAVLLALSASLWGAETSVEGGPTETSFNSGTFAYIHATVHGLAGRPKRYVVSAEIQYLGTTASTSVELDRLPETKSGVEEFQGGWPIPAQAPTGFYSLTLHVEDRIEHSPEVSRKVRGFVVYKKLVRISRVTLDKAIYNAGEPIKCEVGLENLAETDMKGLRVEFSNAVYPWIPLSPQGGRNDPDLAVRTLHEHVDVPAGTAVTIPMTAVGPATLSRSKPGDAPGTGINPGAAQGNNKAAAPESVGYVVSLWNADHTVLYDLQFTAQVVVHTLDRDLPKPYSPGYNHPYNSQIDFSKYREFYAPGQVSAALRVDTARTLYRAGDTVKITATLKNPGPEAWNAVTLRALITDAKGREVYSGTLLSGVNLASAATQKLNASAWTISSAQSPGTFPVELTLTGDAGKLLARVTTEIAVNDLPASLLIVCPHASDEPNYAGLICAAMEEGIPIKVVVLTAGDPGECQRYFDKSCDPSEAREFATVEMEESAEALEHLGLSRDQGTELGLPEGGLGAIWFDHRELSNPLLAVDLACEHAPFENVYKPNLSYAREAVVEALRQIIAGFHPAMIAVAHPDDRDLDQRAASWLVIRACRELVKSKELDPQTVLLAGRARGPAGPKLAPYKYENVTVHLSGEAAALKQEMAWIYQSQNGNRDEAEKKTLAELPREEQHLRIVDWQEHEGWNEGGRN